MQSYHATKRLELHFLKETMHGPQSAILSTLDLSTLAWPRAAGKTKCINHFLINDCWYMVDLPGYGYAKVGVDGRQAFDRFTREYLTQR